MTDVLLRCWLRATIIKALLVSSTVFITPLWSVGPKQQSRPRSRGLFEEDGGGNPFYTERQVVRRALVGGPS
jgi:hypothetical protein